MALAHQITNQPLLSSPPCLPRTNGSNARTARTPFLGHSCCLKLRDTARSCVVVRASSSAQAEPKSGGGDGDGGQEPYEEYEVEILKPYGLKFAKGRDGGTYIEAIFPGSSAEQTGKFTVGDKVIATRSVRSDDPLTPANPQQFQNDRPIKISSVLLTDGKFTAPSLERKSGRRQGTARPCTASARELALST